jgi:hypothetical protein
MTRSATRQSWSRRVKTSRLTFCCILENTPNEKIAPAIEEPCAASVSEAAKSDYVDRPSQRRTACRSAFALRILGASNRGLLSRERCFCAPDRKERFRRRRLVLSQSRSLLTTILFWRKALRAFVRPKRSLARPKFDVRGAVCLSGACALGRNQQA